MIAMTIRFIKSMARHQWAKLCGYEVIAPGGIQAFRNQKCGVCPFNREGQCEKCDCLILAKTMMALERCPIRLWNPVWIKSAGSAKP